MSRVDTFIVSTPASFSGAMSEPAGPVASTATGHTGRHFSTSSASRSTTHPVPRRCSTTSMWPIPSARRPPTPIAAADRSGGTSTANAGRPSSSDSRSVSSPQRSRSTTVAVRGSSQMPKRSRANSASGRAFRSRSMNSSLMRIPNAGLACAHASRSSRSHLGSAEYSR